MVTKRITMIGLSVVLLLGLVLAACVAPAPAPTPATPSTTTPPPITKGPSPLEKVIEGAKKEGTVNWLTTSPFKAEDVAQGIKAKYGVDLKVVIVAGDQTASLATTVMEIKSGTTPSLDVMQMAIGNAIGTGRPGGAIADIDWKSLIAEVKDIDSQLYLPPPADVMCTWSYIDLPMYDKTKVSQDQLPKSYYDFTDPKWKGKFGWVGATAQNIEIIHMLGLSDEKGLKYISDIVANKPDLGRLQAQRTKLQMGELAMTLGASRDLNRINKQEPNNTIDWTLLKEFLRINEHTQMVVKGAKNINAAILLTLFLCTPEGLKLTGDQTDIFFYTVPGTLEYKAVEAAKKAGVKVISLSRDKAWLEYLLTPAYTDFSKQVDLALKGGQTGGRGK